jgi:hypothetical protein
MFPVGSSGGDILEIFLVEAMEIQGEQRCQQTSGLQPLVGRVIQKKLDEYLLVVGTLVDVGVGGRFGVAAEFVVQAANCVHIVVQLLMIRPAVLAGDQTQQRAHFGVEQQLTHREKDHWSCVIFLELGLASSLQ